MTRTWRSTAIVAAAALVLAACGGDDAADDVGATAATDEATETAAATDRPTDDATSGGEDATTPVTTPAEGATDDAGASGSVTLATASSDLGTIVTDDAGMTLYVFDNDSSGESTCYEACAQTWPPLTGEASAGDGIDAGLIATSERTDGTTQVTYDGKPLYYYAPDAAPGDVNGQGVGDVWWVVGPDGTTITEAVDAASTSGVVGY
jgi:predicted lipoprotein with Yx(FWY)xxD motif